MIRNETRLLATKAFMFTPEQAEAIFRLQGEANDAMSTAWRTTCDQHIPYFRAAYIEAIEALTAHGYKWWKKEQPNSEHIKMELIDILHFVVSNELRDRIQVMEAYPSGEIKMESLEAAMSLTNIIEYVEYDMTSVSTDYRNVNELPFAELIDQFLIASLVNRSAMFQWLCAMFDYMKMTPNEVFGMYVGKNALNKLRAKYGQAEGKYVRQWFTFMDDNDALTKFIHRNVENNDPITEESVTNYLESTYHKQVISKNKQP